MYTTISKKIAIAKMKYDNFDFENIGLDDGKSKLWALLLYPDNPIHVKAKEKISDLDCEFAGILHDSDKLDDGISDAKPHWHFMLRFRNQVYPKPILKELGLDERWIRKVDSFIRFGRYLVHKDQPNKYQYSTDCLFGDLTDKVCESVSKTSAEDEAVRVNKLIDLIYDSEFKGSPLVFYIQRICDAGLYAEFRRNANVFIKLINHANGFND